MDERRKNHAMRRFIETVLADVATGVKDVRGAAAQMCAVGVPLAVAARVLVQPHPGPGSPSAALAGAGEPGL